MGKLISGLRRQWAGYLSLFLVLGGGVAYASHEIIDGSDVVDESLTGADILDGSVRSSEVRDLRSADIRDDTLAGGGLTGADVNESTLQANAPHPVIAWQPGVDCPISRPIGQFCGYALANAHWANYGSGFEDARYFKDLSGNVHIEGHVALVGGPASGLMFVLPQDYRPSKTRLFTVSYEEGGVTKATYVKVFANGWVTLRDNDVSQATYLQLDGIVFRR